MLHRYSFFVRHFSHEKIFSFISIISIITSFINVTFFFSFYADHTQSSPI